MKIIETFMLLNYVGTVKFTRIRVVFEIYFC
jgi:hypothetical protein